MRRYLPKDLELVCRHAQNDLHTTTSILTTPLAKRCVTPFSPASGERKAVAECRTSDITLAEFKTLKGKMDAVDESATTISATTFVVSPPRERPIDWH